MLVRVQEKEKALPSEEGEGISKQKSSVQVLVPSGT
jgi:hypothetical protein